MRKFILISILFIILFSSISCSVSRTLKVIVLDTKGNPVQGAWVSILSYEEGETGKDGWVTFKLQPKEYIVKVEKPGFFSVKRKIDLKIQREVTFKLLSFKEGMSKIVESISRDLPEKRKFKTVVYGSFPAGSINFTAKFFLDEGKIIVESDELKSEVSIEFKNNEFRYNGKPFPSEEEQYLPYVIKLINDSVLFIKDYPLRLTLKYTGSTTYFSNISFKQVKKDFNFFGFFVIDNATLKIRKEYIDFYAVDRLGRKTHYSIWFYYDNE
ncbi:MAG: hypothetical protein DRI28_05005 [Caldiserica bacterium]|nr:MAG: hypothetical protein DRI28_05005 [Caldisericota bacterium]